MMLETYQNNISMLRHRWPSIADKIDMTDIEQLEFEIIEGEYSTISIDGLQISSRVDPIEEALRYRQLVDSDDYVLWGMALGHLPHLLCQDPNAKSINIILFNFELTKLVLHLVPCDWLADPRVTMNMVFDGCDNLNKLIATLSFENSIIITSESTLASRTMPWLSRRFEDRMYTVHCKLGHLERDSEYERIEHTNLKLLRKIKPIEEYLLSPVEEAIIVGAGPSLEAHIDELKATYEQVDRPEIIAVASASTCLKRHGIKPDAVCAIEIDSPDSLFDYSIAKSTPLLFASRMPQRIFAKWHGPKYYFHLSDPTYDRFAEALPGFRMYVYGSVIHPTIFSALARGAKKVFLLGCDFGFPNEKVHAGLDNSATSKIDMNTWVENGYGEEIKSESSYRMFLTGVESLIQQNPDVEFINWSRIGAKIIGTRYIDIEELTRG
ncbi:conserved protein [Vibrio variabilis]|uniref:Conserved protein n=1 Tax=Vibrio variabilis TaxID=990271 RepID=A0ABQ0JGX5_9VIBR|nr:conserved protein [Vibrio variabilis]